MRDIFFPGNPNCPVASFESYISKLNPKCEAIWQRPKDFVYEGDNVGKHLLGLMMTNITYMCHMLVICRIQLFFC
jgi:hypothetical protein